MSVELIRVTSRHYRVVVGGADIGQLRLSTWDGTWMAFSRRGFPIGQPHRAREDAAEELLRRD